MEKGSREPVGPLVSSRPFLCPTGLTTPEAVPVPPSLSRKAWLPSRSRAGLSGPSARLCLGPRYRGGHSQAPPPVYSLPHPTCAHAHTHSLSLSLSAALQVCSLPLHPLTTNICRAVGSGEMQETRHSPHLHRAPGPVEEIHRNTHIIMQGGPCRGLRSQWVTPGRVP